MRLAAVVVVAVPLLAGCAASEPERVDAEASQPASCGRYANRNAPPDGAQRSMNSCILAALETGERSTLRFSRLTVEGDPIEHELEVLGPGRVEIVVDNREDAFGDRTVRRYVCAELRESNGFLEWDGCEETSR